MKTLNVITNDTTEKPTPASNYMFKVNNRNTRTRCEICSKLTLKKVERRHWRRSGVFIVNSEQILCRLTTSIWCHCSHLLQNWTVLMTCFYLEV